MRRSRLGTVWAQEEQEEQEAGGRREESSLYAPGEEGPANQRAGIGGSGITGGGAGGAGASMGGEQAAAPHASGEEKKGGAGESAGGDPGGSGILHLFILERPFQAQGKKGALANQRAGIQRGIGHYGALPARPTAGRIWREGPVRHNAWGGANQRAGSGHCGAMAPKPLRC
ncbi:hypothetical protein V491_03852 [Pseudogymnoascus sp. VKM F-3775]|nr:hypothetical protein V491_03852 [Pseudogymnoascus sp. VKM F-3775]